MAIVKASSAVKYITLPGLLPRLKGLFFNGFSLLAYYVALVFGIAKLVPQGHPYLNQANIGRFGIMQAVGVAWQNLNFNWKNIDRVIFFFAVIAGLFMILAYIAGALFFLMTAPALAFGGQGVPIGSWFSNPLPADDIAFMMMDRMLGIPGVFDSRVTTTTEFGPMPNAFHYGLQALFAYFSWAMFVIGVMIFLYFIVELVVETSFTGTPFGKHFENVFIPLRLVAGLGLLIPISYGLNSAQWITLYVAKYGSNFATNAWIAFNQGMENPMGLENRELVAVPKTPDFSGLAKDLFTIRACIDVNDKLLYTAMIKKGLASGDANITASQSDVPVYDADGNQVITAVGASNKNRIMSYFVKDGEAFNIIGKQPRGKSWPDGYANNYINMYLEGLRFYEGKDVKIVFGKYNPDLNNKYPGNVEPVCGEIIIPSLLPPGAQVPAGDIQGPDVNEGILIGASHMFAAMQLTESITKEGYAKDSGSDEQQAAYWQMRAATDRYYYQETTEGRTKINKRIIDAENDPDYDATQSGNPECPNDSDGDGYDDGFVYGTSNNGTQVNYPELGVCTGPVDSSFFVALVEQYQRYLSYGPTMGYDFYTGRGQDSIDTRCDILSNCAADASAKNNCYRMQQSCAIESAGYKDYLPFPSVYYEDLGVQNPFLMQVIKYGWGGAGIWYKYIAEKNGALTTASSTLPKLTHYPLLMEQIAKEKAANDKSVQAGGCEKYNPASLGSDPISIGTSTGDSHSLSLLFYNLCSDIHLNEMIALPATETMKTGNPVLDAMNSILGTSSLFSFRENSIVNPLAQMAAMGRALLDRSINMIMGSALGAGIGGLASLLGSAMGSDAGSAGPVLLTGGAFAHSLAQMTVSMAMLGLTGGVLLYYVIPFMPFMYFFFAVGTWVKTIFEALVGMPLWALAHLRLDDSPGFSGQAASGGYWMLLEIFIRPIVTLFALLASLLIFIALAYVLNICWGVVTNNVVGFDPNYKMSTNALEMAFYRPAVDQFFYTILYIIIMYMLATGSFKLIDLIPDNIMRWIAAVKPFGPNDSADEMVGSVNQIVGIPIFTNVSPIISKGVDLVYETPAGVGGIIGDVRNFAQRLTPPAPKAGGTSQE